jgi:hypothetical protein
MLNRRELNPFDASIQTSVTFDFPHPRKNFDYNSDRRAQIRESLHTFFEKVKQQLLKLARYSITQVCGLAAIASAQFWI